MAKNTIFVSPASTVQPIVAEALAAAALSPGNLLNKDATGKFEKHGTAGGGTEVMLYIANANFLEQLTVSDALTSGDTVQAFEPRAGESYHMLVATSQTIDVLDKPLTSNGDGTLKIGTPATDDILCYADEVITTTAVTLVKVKFK
jgi:hypothetical protein